MTTEQDSFNVAATWKSIMSHPSYLRVEGEKILLAVKVQPRASKNEIGEPLGEELRVKVTAPPIDAAANEALVELLADRLHCGKSRVELVRGHASRHKLIRLHGFTAEQVLPILASSST